MNTQEIIARQSQQYRKFALPFSILEMQANHFKNIDRIGEIYNKFQAFNIPSEAAKTTAQLSITSKAIGGLDNKTRELISSTMSPSTAVMEMVKQLQDINEYNETFQKINKIAAQVAISNSSVDFSSKYAFYFKEYNLFENSESEIEEDQNSKVIILNESKRLKNIITDIYNDNAKLLSINPREFEEVIAELLATRGFKIELTKQTRDNGYDIMGIGYLGTDFPIKFLVECKRFRQDKVGVEIIRGFKDVIATENANKGIIVTTSYFTKDAIKKQKETPYLLDFRDKDSVLNWVNEYCNPSGLIAQDMHPPLVRVSNADAAI